MNEKQYQKWLKKREGIINYYVGQIKKESEYYAWFVDPRKIREDVEKFLEEESDKLIEENIIDIVVDLTVEKLIEEINETARVS